MADNKWLLKLLSYDEVKRNQIIDDAFNDYFSLIADIAADIYDSCIKDFYAQYGPPNFPIKYDRHGDKTGFNLYQANDMTYNPADDSIHLFANADELLPYEGKNGARRRQVVLDAVMKGVRGSKSKKTPPGWPMKWFTKYPNKYSKYQGEWSSSKNTMDSIFDDFVENVAKDTKNLYWDYIKKYI